MYSESVFHCNVCLPHVLTIMCYTAVRTIKNNNTRDDRVESLSVYLGLMSQTDLKMVAFVCDIFCTRAKNVPQHCKYLPTVNKADLKNVILMSVHVGLWLYKNQY